MRPSLQKNANRKFGSRKNKVRLVSSSWTRNLTLYTHFISCTNEQALKNIKLCIETKTICVHSPFGPNLSFLGNRSRMGWFGFVLFISIKNKGLMHVHTYMLWFSLWWNFVLNPTSKNNLNHSTNKTELHDLNYPVWKFTGKTHSFETGIKQIRRRVASPSITNQEVQRDAICEKENLVGL